MKLLFVVTGVGLGDATREHANMKAFLDKDPNTEILVAGYDNSYEYFKAKFPTIKIKGYKIHGKRLKFNVLSFALSNFTLPFIWIWQAFKLRLLVKRYNPDIIISDFEPTGITIAKLVKKKCVMIFGYDPLAYDDFIKKHKVPRIMALEHEYLKSVYANADFAIIQTLGKKKNSMIYHYVNPISRIKPEDLHAESTLMKKLGLKKSPILVMLGGSEFGLKLAKDIDTMASKFRNENFIMLGASKVIPRSKNVIHYPFKENVFEYMKVAKGVITLAGQKSITESLVFKKPMLVFPIEGHIEQALNAFAVQGNAMVCWKSSKAKKAIADFIKAIPPLSRKMKKLNIKADGSEEVVKLVYGLLRQ